MLEAELSTAAPAAPRLHPNLAEVYRQKVAGLVAALAQEDGAEAREQVRGLVDSILLVPEDGRLRIEIRGELASILALSANAKTPSASRDASALAVQVKMVAGKGNHRQLSPIRVAC